MDDEHLDRLAKLRADFEQARAAVGELAPIISDYFNGLLATGFTRAEALQLSIALQTGVLQVSSRAEGEA